MMRSSEVPELTEISVEEKELLVDMTNDLFTHLIESKALQNPIEAQVIAAAFFVEQHEKGWRFTKCQEKEEDSSKEKQPSEDTNTG